jgi:hypothetical protein
MSDPRHERHERAGESTKALPASQPVLWRKEEDRRRYRLPCRPAWRAVLCCGALCSDSLSDSLSAHVCCNHALPSCVQECLNLTPPYSCCCCSPRPPSISSGSPSKAGSSATGTLS